MRAAVSVAIRTGIPVREWLDGDGRALDTALELLADNHQPARRGGAQMSG